MNTPESRAKITIPFEEFRGANYDDGFNSERDIGNVKVSFNLDKSKEISGVEIKGPTQILIEHFPALTLEMVPESAIFLNSSEYLGVVGRIDDEEFDHLLEQGMETVFEDGGYEVTGPVAIIAQTFPSFINR